MDGARKHFGRGKESARLFWLWEIGEVGGDFFPVVDAEEAGGAEVVGGCVEEALTDEVLDVAGEIVDEVVGSQDAFVAAKNVVGLRNEGKVALEPAEFGVKGEGDDHGCAGDEDVVTMAEVVENGLGVGHDFKVGEEIQFVKVGAQAVVTVEGSDLP